MDSEQLEEFMRSVTQTISEMEQAIADLQLGPSGTAGSVTGSGANTQVAYWTGATALAGDAGWTYNGNDLVVLNEDQNADTTIRVSNANAGAAAFSQVLVKNAAGVGGADGLAFACLGTGFTTAGLTIQDGALIAAGSALTGGLVIRTDANTDMILGTDNVARVRIEGTGNVLIDPGGALAAPDGTLHVHTASAGAVVGVGSVIVENSGNTAISILSPAANAGALVFGSPASATRGGFEYDHATDELRIAIADAIDFVISPDEFKVSTDSHIAMTDDAWVGLGAADGRIEFDSTPATSEVNFLDCNVGVGLAAPLAKLHVDQADNAAAIPVLTLDQADADVVLVKIIGTAAAASADRTLVAASDFGTPGALVGWVQVEIDDVGNRITDGDYYTPIYAAPT